MKAMHVVRIAILGLGIGGASPVLAGISTSPSVRDDIIPIRKELVYNEHDPSEEMDVLGQRGPQCSLSRVMFQNSWLAKVLAFLR